MYSRYAARLHFFHAPLFATLSLFQLYISPYTGQPLPLCNLFNPHTCHQLHFRHHLPLSATVCHLAPSFSSQRRVCLRAPLLSWPRHGRHVALSAISISGAAGWAAAMAPRCRDSRSVSKAGQGAGRCRRHLVCPARM